ncbi:hypothetical protein E3N88_23492 [Mikania micrantha]|uniref:Uncharacterized protein n=1 Tax=Mikania micrantha TaxID=192012 RepID=A0A5N6NDF2_9ASTR|nr:hypothetical protein E3N88_23492 [Mikania micrantha]
MVILARNHYPEHINFREICTPPPPPPTMVVLSFLVDLYEAPSKVRPVNLWMMSKMKLARGAGVEHERSGAPGRWRCENHRGSSIWASPKLRLSCGCWLEGSPEMAAPLTFPSDMFRPEFLSGLKSYWASMALTGPSLFGSIDND